jgi:oligoendopeptidase F
VTKLGAPELSHYAPWVAHLRAGSVEGIDEDVSSLAGDFQSVNREAWRRLYHETLSGLRVEIDGKSFTLDEAGEELGAAETLEKRKEIRAAIAQTLQRDSARMALIYNTIVKDDLLTAKLYKYARPDEGENEQNGISPEVADTMFETVKSSYSSLSHRFYRWKAQQHGVEVMDRAQLGMRLQDAPPPESKAYGFDEARKIILRAYKRFSPKFARIAKQFFDKGHIDAQLRPDKETGAFAMPVGPDTFPYVMLSYAGGVEDLITLGHELGHGVHQVLAQKKRGLFLSEMSTAVSETASIFAEMLVFEELLAKEKDPARKKDLLKDKVEGMILNGLQQLSYHDFERRVHEERKAGELSAGRISDIWIETQKEYFGPSVETDDYDRHFWMVVPHFYDTPFYVYSYSFAQILVSGLYQSYKAAEKEGPDARDEFVANYIELLETGITRNLYEMCRPFDLDPETPEFWRKGLSLMDKYLNELESFDKKPEAAAGPARKKTKKPANDL